MLRLNKDVIKFSEPQIYERQRSGKFSKKTSVTLVLTNLIRGVTAQRTEGVNNNTVIFRQNGVLEISSSNQFPGLDQMFI